MQRVKFLSLASGSSGNCYFLGTDTDGILIDAGIGIRTIKKTLKDYNIDMGTIRAVFVTHDHAAHIKAVGHLGEKHNIPIYTTPEIHYGIRRSYCVTEKLTAPHIFYIEKEQPISIADFEVCCFEVPHDGTDNVGYCIRIFGKTFVFLTDLGHISEVVASYIARANYLVIEANYDREMLKTGPYPLHLKQRIESPNGHMCNRDTAEFLANHLHEGLKNIWLCHISKDNNHPELAFKTFEMVFKEKNIQIGKDVQLAVLKRTTPSNLYFFEENE